LHAGDFDACGETGRTVYSVAMIPERRISGYHCNVHQPVNSPEVFICNPQIGSRTETIL